MAVAVRRNIRDKAYVEVRSATDDSCSILGHLSSEHRCCIPVIVLDSIERACSDAAATAFALSGIYPCFAILIDERIRTAFLGASPASSAALRNDMRMTALVLLHLTRTGTASHADVLYTAAEAGLHVL